MTAFFVLFGIMYVAVIVFVIVIITRTAKHRKNKPKGDYIMPAEPVPAEPAKREREEVKEKTEEKPSPVHANCDHAKAPSPYIDVNDTYSMNWDGFKSFCLKLFTAEYPSATISPYRYRGAPDIQLKTGGKNVDVRLIFVRENRAVDKDAFDAALADVDEGDDVADWIVTNGTYTIMQKSAAAAKRVALFDVNNVAAMMRRCNISAKKDERKH